ncbi:MAG: outer membrane beta-barrel protein [Planctomycetota bacterium]
MRSIWVVLFASVLLHVSAAAVAQDGGDVTDGVSGSPGARGLLAEFRPRFYVRGGGALVLPADVDLESDSLGFTGDDEFLRSDVGFGYHAAAGLRFVPEGSRYGTGLRIEFEFADRRYDTDGIGRDGDGIFRDVDGRVDTMTFMGNILADVSFDSFRGYGGIGFGVAEVDVRAEGLSDSDTNFALQIPFGIETKLLPHVYLDTGCRFLFVPSVDTDTILSEFSVLTAELYLGLTLEI